MPYTLPYWRETSGPWCTNWLQSGKYQILQHKTVYLNSITESAPHHVAADVASTLVGAVAGGAGAELIGLPTASSYANITPTTSAVKYVRMSINPKLTLFLSRETAIAQKRPYHASGQM